MGHPSFHTYVWDGENRPVTYDSGTSATTVTYDALGREVEFSASTGKTEVLYGPTGTKLATASGTTLYHGYVPLPAGAVALYIGGATPVLSRLGSLAY